MVKRTIVFVFILLSTKLFGQYADNTQEYIIMANNIEDSLFCVNHYPYYDFETKSHNYGVGFPEKMIDGKEKTLLAIFKTVQNELLNNFCSLNKDLLVTVTLLIDRDGQVRGGIYQNNERNNFEMANFAFQKLKEYEYTPAYNGGKPMTFCVTFMVKVHAGAGL